MILRSQALTEMVGHGTVETGKLEGRKSIHYALNNTS